MSEVTQEQLDQHLEMLSQHEYVVLPKGEDADFDSANEPLSHNKPYTLSSWTASSGKTYYSLEGFFGEDEYVQTELEDVTPEEWLRLQPASEEQVSQMDYASTMVDL